MQVHIASFNVLAPSWASPQYYPSESHTALFPSEGRMDKVARHTLSHFPKADIIAFQETEGSLNRQLAAHLTDAYDYFPVYHDDSYWAKWVTSDRPFERNGVSLALRRGAFDRIAHLNLPLGSGNHAAVALCRHSALDQWFRIASVHFELDDASIRAAEVETLSTFFRLSSSRGPCVDVIAGDFNSDLDNELMEAQLLDFGFVDVHRALGAASATHPEGEGDDIVGWTKFLSDHVLVRGLNVEPTRAQTFSGDIMERHPHLTPAHKAARLAATLAFNGSDHFALEAVVRVPYGHTHSRLHSA